jgi:hypothetical protein
VNAAAKHLGLPPCSLTRLLIQQDFQTEDEIGSAADGYHPHIQTVEAVLELGLEKVTVQNAFPACLVRDSVTAYAPNSAVIWVQEKVGLVEHVGAVEVAWRAILTAFDQTDFAVGQVSLAYEGPLGYSIAALAQMEAEAVKVLQHHRLVVLGSEQLGLESEVLVVHRASQPGSGHQIHVALAPIPSCTSCRS